MTLHLWLLNLAAYCAQIAAVVTIGAALPYLFRMRRPDVMLIYRQTLLAACLLLPLLQPWKRPLVSSSAGVSISSVTIFNGPAKGPRWPSLEEIAALLLCSGIFARLGWLAIGVRRLRRHRRRAELLTPLPSIFQTLQQRLGVRPSICLSDDVAGPVTFGVRRAVILLPSRFLDMPAGAQEAIVCHELAHVRRGDWAFTMIEEFLRALFWFHPAMWWLLGQIQLTREQAVDGEVIRVTASREQYIDALLAVAGGRLQSDLAPAPLFLQKSHLSQRVALILKGVSMSKQRLLSLLAAICGALLITARFAVIYFPMTAPAQEVVKGESNLLHRAPLDYPAEARDKGIEGTVVVEATLNDRGVVTDARVLSGPEPLRKSALRSVLDWHYAAQTPSPVEVAVDYKLPPKSTAILRRLEPQTVESGTLSRIQLSALSPRLRDEVAARLPVKVGDQFETGMLARVRQAVRDIDEHLDARVMTTTHTDAGKSFGLQIFSTAPMESPASMLSSQRIRVGGNVQSEQRIGGPNPTYPPLAKQARIQGVVRFNVVVNKDGTVQDVELVAGHPLLAEAAIDAVRQWVYKPTLLNGQPVEVATVVDVNFTLSQ